jgi:hypothetical protein
MVVLELLIALALAFAVVLTVHKVARAQSHQTPVYDKDGRYQGSVFDYGKTQTYTDRNGRFVGSAINNGNGTTSFYGQHGQFQGSAGSSIDRAFNFKR